MRIWTERNQIWLYVAAIAGGLLAGWLAPAAQALEHAINPSIGILLYATFLGVPFTRLPDAFRDPKFLGALLALNFIVVPLIVLGLSRFVATDDALLIGVLLVLLTPCIDYVIVFAGIAGGAHHKLVAAAPILMIVQLLLLPLYISLIAGPGVFSEIDPEPFVEAFIYLIAIPLALAALTQWAAKRMHWAARIMSAAEQAMVALMILTLFVVVASQAGLVVANLGGLGSVVPIYAAFLLVMAFVGLGVSRLARLSIPDARALVFSGATRNSLVVLPLALALPAQLSLVPALVVAQTLVELVGMIVYVRLIPKLV